MGWFDILTDAADILVSQDKAKAVQRVSQRQIVRSATRPDIPKQQPKKEQNPVLRPSKSVPIGGIRASEFYMRINAITTSEAQISDNLFMVSGDMETGDLRVGEYLHFRAPKIEPIRLQCMRILNDRMEDKRSVSHAGYNPFIILKSESKTEIDVIRQCIDKYYSCRICNMDYKDKF